MKSINLIPQQPANIGSFAKLGSEKMAKTDGIS